MISAAELANHLGGSRCEGKGWRALCPAHNDRTPSLSIVEKNGKVLFICRAGCDQKAVLDALKARGLWGGYTKLDPEADRTRREQRRRERALQVFLDRNRDTSIPAWALFSLYNRPFHTI